MIASVQYNDLTGTAAADIADVHYNSLQKFLTDSFSSYAGDRFSCRGCTAYLGSRDNVYVSFICLDKETNEFVKFRPENPWPLRAFFQIFKRFEIVIGRDMNEIHIPDGQESLVLNNGEIEEIS